MLTGGNEVSIYALLYLIGRESKGDVLVASYRYKTVGSGQFIALHQAS